MSLRFGDVEQAFADADRVFEDTFFYQGNTHLPIEQHAAVAAKDPDGKLVLWSSTQTPHYVHRALARALAVPAAHIRVIATPNGGGFGGKSDPFNHEIVVSRAALMLDRPVKICLTREEVFYCHRGRHPVLMRFKTGVKNDGTITGMHVKTLLDGGAYGSYGVASTFYTGALQTVTYHVPAYHFEGCRVFTNKPPCGPKRGHGTPQSRFGQEVQLDKIGEALQIDPAELRLRIVEQPDTLTANYLRVGTIGLAECIRRVTKAADWTNTFGKLPFGRGVGIACSSYLSGAGLPIYYNDMPHSGVQLKLDRSGGVTAFCGATEIGQGSDDVLVGCVAEVLGIEPIDIRAVTGDTDLTPVDLGSYSSRVTLMMGNAAIQAAERARDQLADAVSKKLSVPKDRLAFADRRVFDTENADTGVSFAEAVCLAEAMFGTHRDDRLVHAAALRGEIQGRRRRAFTHLLLLRRHRRSRRRSVVGLDPRAARLDRARHRALAQSDARARAGRRQRLHGDRRGADGGADVPAPAAEAVSRAGAQVPIDAGIQEPDHARHARGRDGTGGEPGPARSLRREGSRSGAPAAGDAGGGERGLRRDRRPDRRGADHAGKDPQGARREGGRQGSALRPGALS